MKRNPVLIAAVLAGLSTPAMAQEYTKIKLNVVGNIGITTQYKELEQPFWAKKVAEATGGAVTAQVKPWNEMGLKGPEVIRLLRQGLFDFGTTQLGFLAGDNAINDATDLAGLTTSLEQFRDVTEKFRPALTDYYAKQGVKVLGLWSFQAQVLYCRDEIRRLSDLKGRKVRTSGASQADFVQYFGGSGISMAFGEVQQALQNGVIDCAITGTLGGYKAKWYEGAKYLYTLPINWGAAIQATSAKSWSKLSPATQKVLVRGIRQLERDIDAQNKRENEIGIACNTGHGACPDGPPAAMVLVPASPDDRELRHKALTQAVLPNWAKRCGAACAKTWNETVGRVVHMTAKPV